MSKAFVIMQQGFQYNDETYDVQEGGNAVKAFTDFNTAKEQCIKMTIEAFDIGNHYAYRYSEYNKIFGQNISPELGEVLQNAGFFEDQDFRDFFESNWRNLPYWAKIEFVSKLYIPLYYVEKVELD